MTKRIEKADIWTGGKHMRGCSAHVAKEMPIQTSDRYHYTPTRTAQSVRTRTLPGESEERGEPELSCIAAGDRINMTTLENS